MQHKSPPELLSYVSARFLVSHPRWSLLFRPSSLQDMCYEVDWELQLWEQGRRMFRPGRWEDDIQRWLGAKWGVQRQRRGWRWCSPEQDHHLWCTEVDTEWKEWRQWRQTLSDNVAVPEYSRCTCNIRSQCLLYLNAIKEANLIIWFHVTYTYQGGTSSILYMRSSLVGAGFVSVSNSTRSLLFPRSGAAYNDECKISK